MRSIENWISPEELNEKDWVLATYYVELPPGASAVNTASEIAIGQTTGTWVELPGDLMEKVSACNAHFEAVYRIPPRELRSGENLSQAAVIRIAFPNRDFDTDLTLLLTLLVGNEPSTSQTMKLLDIGFPTAFMDSLPGPRFGIDGLRRLLEVYDRPLLNNIIKPCIGMSPQEGAEIAYQAALGGVDIIKDDEKVCDQEFSPLNERVKCYKDAIRRANEESGQKTLYAANISGRISKLRDNALRARDAGADMLMFSYMSVGLTGLQALSEDTEINLPLLAHPNLAPVWYESPKLGISAHLVIGKLPRLSGSDLVVQPSPYGRYPILADAYLHYTRALSIPMGKIKAAMPLVGGGIHPGIIPQLVGDLGIEFVVGAGGAIQGHPDGITAGAQAMRQALDAAACGITLAEFAREHPQLKAALEKWK
jgi:2,3-diketo-5-methylthiopentyl-1-phosphate enolase